MLIIVLIGTISRLHPSEPLFWLISAAALVLGARLCWRRYQVQDEFGRLVFLKSWTISGFISMNGAGVLLLWGTYQGTLPVTDLYPVLPTISLRPIHACLVAGLLATGISNLYLRHARQE